MSKDRPHSLVQLRRIERPKLVREVVTPEGVPLRFSLASAGDRAGAFVLDMLLQILLVLALVLGLSLTGFSPGGSWLEALILVLSFLLLTFYFAVFEVRWQGSTPGKRIIGIRVIDARGGQLEGSAVLARNLIRELEVWTPLRFLLASDLLWPGAPWWATLFAIAWTLVFMLMPLFNKDRLRIGDLIAGTRVVVQPKAVLVPDLVDEAAAASPIGPAATATHVFTQDQLTKYGIFELQVLEGLLRSPATNTFQHHQAVQVVVDRVRAKIDYTGPIPDAEQFLRDFYAAQRAHLEQKMLLGQRREDKYASQ